VGKSLELNFKPSRDFGTDWHSYFREYKDYRDQKMAAANQVKAEPEVVTVLSTGEVPIGDIVKINKNGSINRQSILGRVAALLEESTLEVKAGKSVYQRGDGELSEHVWLEAAGQGVRITAQGTDIVYNGKLITVEELEELLGED